ncbi:hypothetical protein ITP53_11380 [Nonomuraea sp. K274]|uniref:Uncharacterized protein n=1 Tax=Nonomuraea cypriaca TaxID=1187855 RepID=A0A931AAF8_9ACTN|nr:hypothetical protein [Nonomuraea cypriaca]MBF8186340.1 hypothetical protein [Nonomuraea cypriaca]
MTATSGDPENHQKNPAAPDTPPAEFPIYDETIPVQYRCPYCLYCWSGAAQ